MSSVDLDLPIVSSAPLSTTMRDSIRDEWLLTTLAFAFGLAALLLAAIGLYGVMTYAVARRTSELGLRTALGADRGAIFHLVLGDGLRLVAFGMATGAPLALFAARLLRAELHNVPPTDPISLTIALIVLMVCAVVAALLSALRASRVPPMVALNRE